MQWSKLFRRCRHKYVITYRSERLVILTCTECGTTKSIRLGDKKAWLRKLRDEMYWSKDEPVGLLDRISKAFEAFRDANSASRRWSKFGKDHFRGDKR